MTIDDLADRCEAIKADLSIREDVRQLISDLEHQMVTLVLNHRHYVEWTTNKMYGNDVQQWEDRMGGQFTSEEIIKAGRNNW